MNKGTEYYGEVSRNFILFYLLAGSLSFMWVWGRVFRDYQPPKKWLSGLVLKEVLISYFQQQQPDISEDISTKINIPQEIAELFRVRDLPVVLGSEELGVSLYNLHLYLDRFSFNCQDKFIFIRYLDDLEEIRIPTFFPLFNKCEQSEQM